MKSKIWINQDCEIGYSISIQKELVNKYGLETENIYSNNFPINNDTKLTSNIGQFSFEDLVELHRQLSIFLGIE
jgi:hypothetical protein